MITEKVTNDVATKLFAQMYDAAFNAALKQDGDEYLAGFRNNFEKMFRAGWQACLDFNRAAEILERDDDAAKKGE